LTAHQAALAQQLEGRRGFAARIVRNRHHWQSFRILDDYLDQCRSSPSWLSENEISKIVRDSLIIMDEKKIRLYCYSIMPNHVHSLFKPLRDDRGAIFSLADIMQAHKGFTSKQANKVLGRAGTFWQSESFDHYIRDQAEFHRIALYTMNNPVKAGLVRSIWDWPNTWIEPGLARELGLIVHRK
jgi:REP element-mobilizing transposase RayT